jgi:manganese oxidase
MQRSLVVLACLALVGCVNDPEPSQDRSRPTEGELREFHLYVSEEFIHEPYEGKRITSLAFSLSPDGPFTVPGPEIRVREGDTVRVTLHAGGLGHTIHWHGLKVPWAMDGVPFITQEVIAGEPNTYVYEWEAKESGTYWYHCHVEAPSHVDAGLFGPLIIEPADAAADPPFDREATVMLHELDSTLFAATNALFGFTDDLGNMPRNPFDAAEAARGTVRQAYDVAGLIEGGTTGQYVLGSEGPRDYYPLASIRYRPQYDTFMINGKSYPETEPIHMESGETLRIRLINAGQLVHSMHLHGTHFLVTHKDGYRLPMAYYADTLLIGPAERYDIYVEGDNPGHWDFHDHGGAWNVGGYASNEYAFPGGMATMLVYDDFEHPGLPKPQPGATSGDYALFAHRH